MPIARVGAAPGPVVVDTPVVVAPIAVGVVGGLPAAADTTEAIGVGYRSLSFLSFPYSGTFNLKSMSRFAL